MYTENTLNLIDDIKKEVSGAPGSPGHDRFHLLQLVDELKLSIETPTETILRLIYQVNGTPYSRNQEQCIDNFTSRRKMPLCALLLILISFRCWSALDKKAVLQLRN